MRIGPNRSYCYTKGAPLDENSVHYSQNLLYNKIYTWRRPELTKSKLMWSQKLHTRYKTTLHKKEPNNFVVSVL